MTYQEFYNLRLNDGDFAALSTFGQAMDWNDFKDDRPCTWCGIDKIVNLTTGKIHCKGCDTLQQEAEERPYSFFKHKAEEKSDKLQRELASNTPVLNFLEASVIAKTVTQSFPYNEIIDLAEYMNGYSEIKIAVSLLHEHQRPEYKENIIAAYRDKLIVGTHAIEADINQAMERGLTGIFKNKNIVDLIVEERDDIVDLKVKERENNSAKIEKTHSWNQLKDEFK